MEPTMFSSIPIQSLIEKIADAVIKSLATEQVPNKKDQLLTRQQTAKILQVSLPTLCTWTHKGLIQAKRINSRVRYSESDVYSALENYNKYRRA